MVSNYDLQSGPGAIPALLYFVPRITHRPSENCSLRCVDSSVSTRNTHDACSKNKKKKAPIEAIELIRLFIVLMKIQYHYEERFDTCFNWIDKG